MSKKMKDYMARTGHFQCYIPSRLEIAGKPEYSIFPLNVFISRYTVRDGKTCTGSVVYEPDLSSFEYDEATKIFKMNYYNRYNHDYYLVMIYDQENKRRQCDKYYKEEELGSADGLDDWNRFFIQVGFLKFKQGETCMFEEVGQKTNAS